MAWRLAKSLKTLLDQVNARWSDRSKASDGTIGDAAHSNRTSDHNPNAAGVVCAIDITHDPARGCDCQLIADALKTSRDRRIKYVIWNGQIMSGAHSARAWVWRPYTGPNPHTKHLHISVIADPRGYDDASPWAALRREPVLTVAGKELPLKQIDGTSWAPVRALCEALGAKVRYDSATGDVEVRK